MHDQMCWFQQHLLQQEHISMPEATLEFPKAVPASRAIYQIPPA
ncbi:hypothetical protein SAMN05216302_1011102 [Nitrosomonas aestuarii]|mgnify:CR=1 FL=1|uniref:Uncharacterized protein n=1 Tax=Nitrosomonas aestuarii TaxID=52441 RepID=A0A1I4B920_9PROT|nr:hypothetical protein SAMN05216302_1011102 [Nitrosomonas aestuarii]